MDRSVEFKYNEKHKIRKMKMEEKSYRKDLKIMTIIVKLIGNHCG